MALPTRTYKGVDIGSNYNFCLVEDESTVIAVPYLPFRYKSLVLLEDGSVCHKGKMYDNLRWGVKSPTAGGTVADVVSPLELPTLAHKALMVSHRVISTYLTTGRDWDPRVFQEDDLVPVIIKEGNLFQVSERPLEDGYTYGADCRLTANNTKDTPLTAMRMADAQHLKNCSDVASVTLQKSSMYSWRARGHVVQWLNRHHPPKCALSTARVYLPWCSVSWMFATRCLGAKRQWAVALNHANSVESAILEEYEAPVLSVEDYL